MGHELCMPTGMMLRHLVSPELATQTRDSRLLPSCGVGPTVVTTVATTGGAMIVDVTGGADVPPDEETGLMPWWYVFS